MAEDRFGAVSLSRDIVAGPAPEIEGRSAGVESGQRTFTVSHSHPFDEPAELLTTHNSPLTITNPYCPLLTGQMRTPKPLRSTSSDLSDSSGPPRSSSN